MQVSIGVEDIRAHTVRGSGEQLYRTRSRPLLRTVYAYIFHFYTELELYIYRSERDTRTQRAVAGDLQF